MIRELGVLFLIGAALVGCCERAQQQRMPSDDVTAKIQGFVDGVLAVGNWEHLPANVAELHLESTRSNYFTTKDRLEIFQWDVDRAVVVIRDEFGHPYFFQKRDDEVTFGSIGPDGEIGTADDRLRTVVRLIRAGLIRAMHSIR